MQLVIHYSYLIPLLPLLGAAISGFFGKRILKNQSHWPIWIGVGCSAALSFVLLLGMLAACHNATAPVGFSVDFFDWIKIGPFTATAGYFFDPLTAVMLAVVTGVGFLITIFAAGYMKGEEGYYRFFAYLGLFIFAMTNLVMGNNLLVLYLGWEGVGLCSYLLIGYYFDRPAASEAAKKAFLVNRIGDFGFAVGIMLVFYAFGTISYYGHGVGTGTGFVEMARHVWIHGGSILTDPAKAEPAIAAGWSIGTVLKYIPFALMLGAFGKSAQFPLYVWLPDAMEGPTPVSALIHAATMVTAGIYMIVRCGTLFFPNQPAMMTISAIGCFTALLAATIALRQFDLKKVFAYSTISQLGYMFVGVGVLAPTAAIFHLVTHAFFKALLFLSSGVIMHAMLGHLDMRKMSGLRHVLPKTRWLILVGCLALAGCPAFSGFFSKDEIVGQSLNHSALIYSALLFTSFLTAYYTFRLYFQVFEGPQIIPTTPADAPALGAVAGMSAAHSSPTDRAEARASHEAVALGTESTSGVDRAAAHGADDAHHDPEPWLMIAPLALLAMGAIFAGYLNWPYAGLARFLGHSPSILYSYDSAVAASANTSAPVVNPEAFGLFGTAAGAGHEEPFISLAMVIGGAISLAGIGLAYLLHLRDRQAADRLAAGLQPLTGALEGKWYVDELYDWIITRPLRWLGGIFYAIDRIVIDGVVWLVGFVPQLSGLALKLGVQRGYLQGYAAAMLFGVLAILLIVFL